MAAMVANVAIIFAHFFCTLMLFELRCMKITLQSVLIYILDNFSNVEWNELPTTIAKKHQHNRRLNSRHAIHVCIYFYSILFYCININTHSSALHQPLSLLNLIEIYFSNKISLWIFSLSVSTLCCSFTN